MLTFTPMPRIAISALQSTVTSASGRMMHSVIGKERKVIRHSTSTEANSARLTHLSAACTASLVAAITPTLPLARRNVTRSVSPPAALNSLIFCTICEIVVAWWSVVKMLTGIAVHFEFMNSLPSRVA